MSNKNLIAFFGIDGSGKSSIIKGIKKRLEQEGKKVKVVYMGLGSEFNLPFLKIAMDISRKFTRDKIKGRKKLRKHNYRQRNFLWVCIQYLELWLRYLKARRLSKDNVVLFDRYFYDGLILGSQSTFNIMKYVTPRPAKSFLIKAPPRIILSRKDEADEEDIEEYYSRAQRLQRYFDISSINNVRDINKIVEEVYRSIYNYS